LWNNAKRGDTRRDSFLRKSISVFTFRLINCEFSSGIGYDKDNQQ